MQPARVEDARPEVTQQGNVYYLQYRPHQQEAKQRRRVWKPLNRLQTWLEGEDKLSAKVGSYGVLAVVVVYFVWQVVRAYG
ncbi:hypothetical protein V6C27_02790 [Peptococcaceae bacterium 1198_IL3148]